MGVAQNGTIAYASEWRMNNIRNMMKTTAESTLHDGCKQGTEDELFYVKSIFY